MNTFFKTFFVCLIAALVFFAYKYVSEESYTPDLSVTKDNPIFSSEKPASKKKTDENQQKTPDVEVSQPVLIPDEKIDKKPQKYFTTCYFYSSSGKLIPIEREISTPPTLEKAISFLFKGPMISETKKGIYSEIPANVDLINIKRQDKSIIVNLSANFGNGGGTQSVENRVRQLAKTIGMFEKGKNIYLHINGKEVEYLGGDGVYIKQPLEY